MTWDQIRGNWKQANGKAKEQWGKPSRADPDGRASDGHQRAASASGTRKPSGDWQRPFTDSWLTQPLHPTDRHGP